MLIPSKGTRCRAISKRYETELKGKHNTSFTILTRILHLLNLPSVQIVISYVNGLCCCSPYSPHGTVMSMRLFIVWMRYSWTDAHEATTLISASDIIVVMEEVGSHYKFRIENGKNRWQNHDIAPLPWRSRLQFCTRFFVCWHSYSFFDKNITVPCATSRPPLVDLASSLFSYLIGL